MTKEDLKKYISKILNFRTQTSYKFYLILGLFELGAKVDELSFVACGREMMIQAWNDLSEEKFKYSKPDKLKDFKGVIMAESGAPEFCLKNNLRKTILNTENEKMVAVYKALTNYCIHCTLSYGQWNKYLAGATTYHQRLPIMEALSKEESCLYEIHGDKIILNSEYFDIINRHKDEFESMVRKELEQYLLR